MINYSYKILEVNEQAKNMLVEYSAEGYPTILVGTKLPSTEEPLEQIIRMFAPVQHWIEQSRVVVLPEVGVTGTIAAADEYAAATQDAPGTPNYF